MHRAQDTHRQEAAGRPSAERRPPDAGRVPGRRPLAPTPAAAGLRGRAVAAIAAWSGTFLETVKRLVLLFVPSLYRRGLVVKVAASLVLLALVGTCLHVLTNRTRDLLVAALSYDPVAHATRLQDEERLVAARDFIEFHEAIPGIEPNPELARIRDEIEETRSTWSYRLGEAWKGLTGHDSEESYARAVSMALEFTVVGDVRALVEEGSKLGTDEEVDSLNLILAGAGLGLGFISTGPQAALLAPTKSFTSFLRYALAFMGHKLREEINVLVARASRSGNKTEALQALRERFADLSSLIRRNPDAAMMVISYSENADDLARNARLAGQLEPKATPILAHGGKTALETAHVLDRRGELSPDLLHRALQYGETGLVWLRHAPLDKLASQVRLVRTSVTGRLFFHLECLLASLPGWVLWSGMLYAGLVLLRTWTSPKQGMRQTIEAAVRR